MRYFLFDFEGTFVKIEIFDEWPKLALAGDPRQAEVVKQIAEITAMGQEGTIPFSESIGRRLQLFAPHKRQIPTIITMLKNSVAPSVFRNRDFFVTNSQNIYIVSSGPKELIVPVVADFGIPASRVIANSLVFDKTGRVTGFNPDNPLMRPSEGKARAVADLKLRGEVIMIGDGMTDYEVKQNGAANTFVAFTENIIREPVVKKADFVAGRLEEVFKNYNISPKPSSRARLKVLLLENIHSLAVKHFEDLGYDVELLPKALPEDELAVKIKDVAVLGIRSNTQVTQAVLESAQQLLAVGRFGIGTNNIDLKAATGRGVAVFNAPFSSTRSVVELVMGFILMLHRHVMDKSMGLHKGLWDKSAKGTHEVRGKILGIVGYGNIGSQLSVLAENLGMRVCFYDTMERPVIGNARRFESLEELLAKSDVVSLHISGRPDGGYVLGQKEFKLMKKGAYVINTSRGFLMNVEALAKALQSGHLGGAALDVFPEEPKQSPSTFTSTLQNSPNVVLTPHIGGTTEEAQESIAGYLSNRLTTFLETGSTELSVNLPAVQAPPRQGACRLVYLHTNTPGVLAKINTLIADHHINILGQYLGTNSAVGYVMTDAEQAYPTGIITKLKAMPETTSWRVLY